MALYNHADDPRSKGLLQSAIEIAQSSGLKSSLSGEHRLICYFYARQKTLHALQSRDIVAAALGLTEMRETAASPEEQAEVAQADVSVANLRRGGAAHGPPRLNGSSRSGPWKAIGSLAVIGVIIVSAAVRSLDDSSSSSSTSTTSGAAPARKVSTSSAGSSAPVVSPGNVGSTTWDDGSATSGAEAEKAAIERQRSNINAREAQLQSTSDQIDSLKRQLQSTASVYPNGAPQYVLDQYESDRQWHNRLAAQYNTMLSTYQSDLDAFNSRVDAYNRRYVLP